MMSMIRMSEIDVESINNYEYKDENGVDFVIVQPQANGPWFRVVNEDYQSFMDEMEMFWHSIYKID